MSHDVSSSYYIKTWALLLVLLVISICGPMLEIQVITLITAFGIAFVKAYIVAAKFMHLNIEKKYISYLLLSMVILMLVFFAGTSPDAMQYSGSNWKKKVVDPGVGVEHVEQNVDQEAVKEGT